MRLKVKFIVVVYNRIEKPKLIISKCSSQLNPDRVSDFMSIIVHINIIVTLFAVWFNYSLGKGCWARLG